MKQFFLFQIPIHFKLKFKLISSANVFCRIKSQILRDRESIFFNVYQDKKINKKISKQIFTLK